VTDTLSADMTEAPPTIDPAEGAGLPHFETPPTPAIPTPWIATQAPTRLFPTATTSPLAGEGWPTLERPTPGGRATATASKDNGYPGLAPVGTSGYPSPADPGPTTNARGGSTQTPSPGES
jgi:hypothetical protein